MSINFLSPILPQAPTVRFEVVLAVLRQELARTILALSQGFALQPAHCAAAKGMMRQVFGRLFEEGDR
jgi:hypothetical protein